MEFHYDTYYYYFKFKKKIILLLIIIIIMIIAHNFAESSIYEYECCRVPGVWR